MATRSASTQIIVLAVAVGRVTRVRWVRVEFELELIRDAQTAGQPGAAGLTGPGLRQLLTIS